MAGGCLGVILAVFRRVNAMPVADAEHEAAVTVRPREKTVLVLAGSATRQSSILDLKRVDHGGTIDRATCGHVNGLAR